MAITEYLPRTLWHYTTVATFQKILLSKQLLASDFRTLNDAKEMHAINPIVNEWLKRNSNAEYTPLDQKQKTTAHS